MLVLLSFAGLDGDLERCILRGFAFDALEVGNTASLLLSLEFDWFRRYLLALSMLAAVEDVAMGLRLPMRLLPVERCLAAAVLADGTSCAVAPVFASLRSSAFLSLEFESHRR
jgi:hypothetical protein